MPNKRRNIKAPKQSNNREDTLRKILLQKKEEVTRNLEKQMGHQFNDELQKRIDDVLDTGDQAMLDMAEELDLSLLEMRNKNLKAIKDALQRLKEGTYGICDGCGTEIPEKRLMVMPFTPFCVDCQHKQELLEKIEKEEDRFK
jgi:DnaK suppressor protein